ncbi:MAG: hypothetical protein ABFD82_12505 [Syntrophaceae bacterium]
MFGGAEMTRGNVQGAEHQQLVAALTTFVDVLRQAVFKSGLAPGQVPFIRPVNFIAVINPDTIHLVVDDVPAGGVPDHLYMDRRKEMPVLSLDAIVGSSVREFGYRQPVGVSLPLTAFVDDEAQRRAVIQPLVDTVIEQLRERALVQNLGLPPGYEHFVRFMPAFLRDHPNPEQSIFLMMRFRAGPQYEEIHRAIRERMAVYGLNVVRADDKDYTGDLWENVCLHMLGCRFGVAVFEEIDLREFNPNVALELGFMIAHGKRCLLLKDQRMPRMPADIIGKLYKEFDSYNITNTVITAVDRWALDMALPRVHVAS